MTLQPSRSSSRLQTLSPFQDATSSARQRTLHPMHCTEVDWHETWQGICSGGCSEGEQHRGSAIVYQHFAEGYEWSPKLRLSRQALEGYITSTRVDKGHYLKSHPAINIAKWRISQSPFPASSPPPVAIHTLPVPGHICTPNLIPMNSVEAPHSSQLRLLPMPRYFHSSLL